MESATRIALALSLVLIVSGTDAAAEAQSTSAGKTSDAGFTVSDIAGLYQMVDPRGYADPLTAATYIRLLTDGRSRLEGVIVSDIGGSINARTEIGSYHRNPWRLRSTAAGEELCFDVGDRSHCAQLERDLATNDLLLFDVSRPRGHADLRLHRVARDEAALGTN